jgi:quinol monooxygenase YgiN
VIVAIGRVVTDDTNREEFLRIAQAGVTASRQDPGCIAYALSEDTADRNHFVFVEQWEDQAALDAHFATDHIAAFMGTLPATLAAPPDVQFHTVSSTVGLPGT